MCWGLGSPPGWRTSGHCPTPTPCCMRSSGSLPSCPTCHAAWRLTPSWAATCFPRWGPPSWTLTGWAGLSLPLPALGQGRYPWESRGPGWPGGTLSLSAHPWGQGVPGPAHLLPHPQGTPVIPLLSSVLLDKTQWETPHQFNPGHFLDAEGRFVKRAAFLPFSAGTHSPRAWGQHRAPRPQVAWSQGISEAQAQACWASLCPQPLATQLCPSELVRIPVTADLALRPPPLQALPHSP